MFCVKFEMYHFYWDRGGCLFVVSEYHFLFECTEYTEYRAELQTAIGINLSDLSTQDMFVNVFNHPHSLSRYIIRAFKKRREKLYRTI